MSFLQGNVPLMTTRGSMREMYQVPRLRRLLLLSPTVSAFHCPLVYGE